MVRRNKPQLETKCHRSYDNRVKRDITVDNYLEVPNVGKSGGLMLLWNNDVDANV